jgi:hypothetical protein
VGYPQHTAVAGREFGTLLPAIGTDFSVGVDQLEHIAPALAGIG